ncbi:MAG: 50S ribosomal protein L35 [Alphaproteobacteria bacterium]|nr:50S ribosomal protein L35 [Alphaproteobacteria bacterium]
MPKLKTKSSVKKRFRLTASGKVRRNQAYKRHGMIKRSPKQIRQLRGSSLLDKADEAIIKPHMPYG